MLWATVIGVLAGAVLIGGGLDTLQPAAITTGQPFTGVPPADLHVFKGLAHEHAVLQEIEALAALRCGR